LGQSGSQPQFPRSPLQFSEPQTVVNPERRGAAGDSPATPRPEDSSLWARLFPHDAPPAVDGAPSAVGCRLGHFRIEATIGAGGMGAVFRAVDERLDRIVALKVLSPSLSRDSASIQRFLNEARAAARLDHDNIARVYFVGEDRGLNFIAHEFVTGRTIRDIIRDHGPLDPREAVNYALQLAAALRHTAAAGVVHRDIKPSNIIITPRGRAKLVDLGLAKKVASESFGDLTIAGTTLGTFDYISPEQAKDPRNVDVRSDIYSLGCTVYHMLTGAPPYPEGTVLQKLLDHQAKDVPDPAAKNPRVPPRLSAVVRHMMAPDPRDRYATPDELILDLLPIAAEMGLRGVNPEGLVWTSHAPQQRSFVERNVVWIAGIAVLALVAFLVDRFPQKIGERGTLVAERPSSEPANLAGGSKLPPATSAQETPQSRASSAPVSAPRDLQAGQTSTPKESPSEFLPFNISPQEPEAVFEPSPGNMPTAGTTNGQATARTESPGNASPKAEKVSAAPPMPDPPTAPATDAQPGKSDTAATDGAAAPAPEISISDGGELPTGYITIEAAVADAKDGSSIELKYNGIRPVPEKPFRISGKRVTIRAGRGYHPVISFSPRELPATGFEGRMITLNNASLDLFDVDVQATVPDATNADHWSLFSFGGPDRLTCRNVNITVTNPGNRQAEIVDISSNAPMPARQPNPMGAPPEFEIELEHCLIRGSCGLFAVRTVEGGRIVVRESALALQGALIANFGDENSSSEMRPIALRMEHLTCFLGGGLIQLDGGDVPRTLVPLDMTVRNNVFASKSQTPLVLLAGRTKEEDFPRLIRWGDGSHNFYDHFSSYWSVNSPTGESSSMPLNFESWKHLLGDKESDSNTGNIAWTHSWQGKSFASIRKADFELAPDSPARAGAADNTDVGADLSLIRSFPDAAGTAALNQTGKSEHVP
jgi:eukaryotic-like serine/threonine-protein kinase